MVKNITNIQIEIIGLFRTNYLAHYHVRKIAKMINKSHATILPHIKKLEKERILLENIVGKNKEYSINFDNIIAKNYLAISEIHANTLLLQDVYLIKKITKEMYYLNLRGAIILFGSYAKKTFNDDSDIDIFYLGKITNKNIQDIRRIGRIYGKVINIKKAGFRNFRIALGKKDPLIMEIVKNHIILQNPEMFVNCLWGFYNERT